MANTMPVLTEEKRQALIADCKLILDYQEPGTSNYMLAKIALASLEAEPSVKVTDVDIYNNKTYWQARQIVERPIHLLGKILYTTPPVTVLKLPDAKEGDPGKMHDVRTRHDFSNGFRFAIEEVKRLNGVANG